MLLGNSNLGKKEEEEEDPEVSEQWRQGLMAEWKTKVLTGTQMKCWGRGRQAAKGTMTKDRMGEQSRRGC